MQPPLLKARLNPLAMPLPLRAMPPPPLAMPLLLRAMPLLPPKAPRRTKLLLQKLRSSNRLLTANGSAWSRSCPSSLRDEGHVPNYRAGQHSRRIALCSGS